MKAIKFLILIAVLGLFVTGSMTLKNRHLLFSETAPAGIVSLQLARSNAIQYQIFSEWNRPENYVFVRDWKDSAVYVERASDGKFDWTSKSSVPGKKVSGVQTARIQLKADNWFIVFYLLSSILIFWFSYKYSLPINQRIKYWQLVVFTIAIIVAGILDWTENYYLKSSIDRFVKLNPTEVFPNRLPQFIEHGSASFAYYVALLKFIILGVIALYFGWSISFFPRLTKWLARRSEDTMFGIRLGWTYRIVIIVLFVLFALLNFSDQGQDLLVTINTSPLGTVIFLFTISVMATLNWYLPKLYTSGFTDLFLTVPEKYRLKSKNEVDYARLLGVVTFLIPGAAILSTMKHYHITYFLDDLPIIVILIGVLIGYYQILKYDLLDRLFVKEGKFLLSRYIQVMVIILVLLICFNFARNVDLEKHGRLSFLSADLFLLSFAFLISVTYRTKIRMVENVRVAPIIMCVGLLLSIAFVLLNIPSILFSVTASFRFLTLPVVISALIAYLMIFSYLLILGKRTHIQWITLLLLFGFMIAYGSISDFHKVHTVQAKAKEPAQLTDYVYKWLKFREDEIRSYPTQHGAPYPIYFVNSYGGGIRASVWATMVVKELDSIMLSTYGFMSINRDFQHHVFSFSGASGGTVGFSLLSAERIAGKDSFATKMFYPDTTSVYTHDFLTANISGIFGRDVLMSVLGQSWYDDRSRLQERAFETVMSNQFRKRYSTSLREMWTGDNMEIPLLFSNTYDINTGKKGIIAPVRLASDDFPSTLFIQDLLKKDKRDLPLSAAAFLSARFPYVSPTGKFDEKHHFTDGGTYENSGAETSRLVAEVVKRVLENETFKGMQLSINMLSVSNGLQRVEQPTADKNLFEVIAPLLGILQTINSNAVKADEVNRVMVERENEKLRLSNVDSISQSNQTSGTILKWSHKKIQPTPEMVNGNWPVLPLGWQISDDALSAMRKSLHRQRREIVKALEPFGILTAELDTVAVFPKSK